MNKTFLFTSCVLILVPLVRIILYKGKDDFGGYDERQEIIRGKGFKYGFLTLIFLETAILLGKEFVEDIPVDFHLIMMACVMSGCLVVILFWIWKDAYWELQQKRLPFGLLMVFVIVLQVVGILMNPVIADGIVIWDGGIFVLTGLFFSIILMNLIVKMILDKKENH